jgi:hypothetical protein
MSALAVWLLGWRAAFCAADQPYEFWDAVYIADQKVGYFHTVSENRDADGQLVIHTRQESQIAIQRFGQKTEMSGVSQTFELPDGRLYAVETRMKTGSEERTIRGVLGNDNNLELTVRAAGKVTTDSIPWSDDILGPFAQDRLLRERPLKPGDTHSFRTYLPELNLITKVTLKAIRKESTKLLHRRSAELLLIEQSTDKVPIKTSIWLDDEGDTVKTSTLLAGLFSMTTYRVSKSEALDVPAEDFNVFDLGEKTAVVPDHPIPKAHSTRSVTYRLELSDESAAKVIPAAPYQTVLSREGRTLQVKVSRRVPSKTPGGPNASPPAEFVEGNGFIQSDDPAIIATARQVAGDATGAWEKAVRLERWVDHNMSNRDFTVGLDSASTVIKTRRGDCTEHAVLLAALCRAAGVPARVAIGLVYVESAGKFFYHMWTEVWVNGSWYAIDGTLGQGFVAGGHIKLGDASLKGASDLSAFLPFFEVLGKLTVKVEAIEP